MRLFLVVSTRERGGCSRRRRRLTAALASPRGKVGLPFVRARVCGVCVCVCRTNDEIRCGSFYPSSLPLRNPAALRSPACRSARTGKTSLGKGGVAIFDRERHRGIAPRRSPRGLRLGFSVARIYVYMRACAYATRRGWPR